MAFNVKLYNVVTVGLAFMLIFTAFQTCSMIQTLVINTIKKKVSSYKGDGYISLAIIYAVFAVCNWIAPSSVSFFGPKYAMLIGGITYCLFIANYLYPLTWGLYLGSTLIGFGAALIWTGQGNFLTINSNADTIARNSGIFWALLQCSLLFGNLFVYFEFRGQEEISDHSRMLTFGVLTAVCVIGTFVVLILRGGGRNSLKQIEDSSQPGAPSVGPKEALIQSFRLLKTPQMLLLCVTFFYTGMELSFFSGVYGTCIGNTKRLGEDAKKYTALSGILIGVGEILGGSMFGLLGKKTNRYGRDPVIILGYIVHVVAFYLIFLNLPDRSPIATGPILDKAYIESNIYVALLCSFLLGFGDSCYNTQVYSILGYVYPDDSAPAFALFKFMQSVSAAIAFFYSLKLTLPYQLLILVICATAGTVTFLPVEWKAYEDALKAKKAENTAKDHTIQ